MQVLSMIRRSFVNISKDLFIFLYTTYVTVYAKTVPIGTTIEIHFMA